MAGCLEDDPGAIEAALAKYKAWTASANTPRPSETLYFRRRYPRADRDPEAERPDGTSWAVAQFNQFQQLSLHTYDDQKDKEDQVGTDVTAGNKSVTTATHHHDDHYPDDQYSDSDDNDVESMASQSDPGSVDFGDSVDQATFDQILEMDDDDEEHDFSRGIVYGFFDQAEGTFTKMDVALEDKDLAELSSLGHFLKGSSATLGLTKVKDSCEKIQHFGAKKDEHGNAENATDDEFLGRIKTTVMTVRTEYAEVEKKLRKFFGES